LGVSDSTKAGDTGWGSGSGWGDADGGWGSNKSPSASGGWGSNKSPSASGGWGESPTDGWGSAGWDSGAASKEPSGDGWGDSSAGAWGSVGWGDSSTGSKESSGWGTSGEVAPPAQEKRDAQEKDKFRPITIPLPPRPVWGASTGWGPQDGEQETKTESRSAKMTSTNRVPMINTKWNKRESTTASSNSEPSEKPRVPPLQTSALGNWTPGEPSALSSANRSEGDYMDVEKWARNDKTMPLKSRSRSPSIPISTVTASTANRKRKSGSTDLEKQQDLWRDFIRCVSQPKP
jgi:hypothetical protein